MNEEERGSVETAEDGRDGRQGRDGQRGDSGRRGQRGKRGKRGRRGRRGRRRHSFLRGLLVFALIFWLLHAYFAEEEGGIPLVPFVNCTSGPHVQQVGILPDMGPFRRFLLRASLHGVMTGAGYAAGATIHKLETTAPSTESISNTIEGIVGTVGDMGGAFLDGVKGGAAPDSEGDGGGGGGDGDGPRPGLPLFPQMPSLPISGCCVPPAVTGEGPELAARAGLAAGWAGSDLVTAVAIAGAESGYDPAAKNPTSSARGLWQTMMSYHRPKYAGASWRDPAANARVAHRIWVEAGRSWSPWAVYTSGAYRAHLAEAEAAVAAVLSGEVATVAAGYSSDEDLGLKPAAQAGADFVRSQFGFTGTIGGARVDPGSEHHVGLAIDVMVAPLGQRAEGAERALGDRIAAYFAGPGREAFGVNNVIWQQRITNEGRGWQWGPMENRGSSTQNHYDHVHIDFHEEGGSGAVPAAGCEGGGVVPASVGAATGGQEVGVASFNVLGSSHTDEPGCNRCSYTDGVERMPAVVQLLGSAGADVAGLQEFQADQQRAFDRLAGGAWDHWGYGDNRIAWRTDTFQLLERASVRVPYFVNWRDMPVAKLLFKPTGQAMWFINVHNPASVRRYGDMSERRAIAQRRELAMVRRLSASGDPVFLLGDMNDRAFGAAASRAGMAVSAPAGWRGIDWVLADGAYFTDHEAMRGPLVRQTSDHPLIVTRVAVGQRS